LQANMATSLAYSISIVWRHSKKWIIQASFIRQFGGVVIDLWIINFADTDLPELVRINESKLNFSNGIPFPLGMDIVCH